MNNKIKIIIVMSILLFSFIPYNVSAWEADSVHIYQRYHSYSDDAEVTDIDVGDSAYFNMTATISQRINGWQFQYFNFTAGVINCSNITQGFFFDISLMSDIGTINNMTGLIGGTWVDYTWEIASGGTWTNNSVNRSIVHVGITGVGCGDANFEINSINDGEMLYGGAEVPYTYHINNLTVHPQRTQSFVVTEDSGDVDLDWIKGSCADNTIIRGRQGTYPTDINNGTFVCNSTGTHFDWAVPNAGETWYFKSWSWNETEGLYSTKNSTDSVTLAGAAVWQIIDSTYNGQIFNVSVWTIIDNTYNGQFYNISSWQIIDNTYNGQIFNISSWQIIDNTYNGVIFNISDSYPIISGPNPVNGSIISTSSVNWSINITDNDGLFNFTIECSNGQSNVTNNAMNGTYNLNITGLVFGTNYTVWVNATDGVWNSSEWYTFTYGAAVPLETYYTTTRVGNTITASAYVRGNCTNTSSNITWIIKDNGGSTIGTRIVNISGNYLVWTLVDTYIFSLGGGESYLVTLNVTNGAEYDEYSTTIIGTSPHNPGTIDPGIEPGTINDLGVSYTKKYTNEWFTSMDFIIIIFGIFLLLIPFIIWKRDDKKDKKYKRRRRPSENIEIVIRGNKK